MFAQKEWSPSNLKSKQQPHCGIGDVWHEQPSSAAVTMSCFKSSMSGKILIIAGPNNYFGNLQTKFVTKV